MPSSLFQDYFTRHADKSDFANKMLQTATTADTEIEGNAEHRFVVPDGGWLINRVCWQKGL